MSIENPNEPRVYIVYEDWDGGRSQHVVAKNRKEAYTKADFPVSKVSWRPWIKFVDGKFIDEHGKEVK